MFVLLLGKFRTSRDSWPEGRPWLPRAICKYLPISNQAARGLDALYMVLLENFPLSLFLTKDLSAFLLLWFVCLFFNHFPSDTTVEKRAFEL